MRIIVVNLGGLSQRFVVEGVNFYIHRISRFCDFQVVTPHSKIKSASKDEKLKKQSNTASRYIDDRRYVILLDLKGKEYTSIDFAKHLNMVMASKKEIVFLIGGDCGSHDEIKEKVDEILSISPFTFNHEIITLILCEIIYRSFCILSNHPYHR